MLHLVAGWLAPPSSRAVGPGFESGPRGLSVENPAGSARAATVVLEFWSVWTC